MRFIIAILLVNALVNTQVYACICISTLACKRLMANQGWAASPQSSRRAPAYFKKLYTCTYTCVYNTCLTGVFNRGVCSRFLVYFSIWVRREMMQNSFRCWGIRIVIMYEWGALIYVNSYMCLYINLLTERGGVLLE